MNQELSYEEREALAKEKVRRRVTIAVVLVLILILHPWAKISAGHRGVVLTFGKVTDVMAPGLHARWPWPIQMVKLEDVRVILLKSPASCYSADIQTVTAETGLNYHLVAEEVGLLYEEVGPDFESRIINPAIQESMKAATAQFESNQLIEDRPAVKALVLEGLRERLSNRHIIVDDFSIIDFAFAEPYENAILEKQVALQNALRAEHELTETETRALARIAEASGEAEAIRIQAQGIAVKGGAEYVQLQAIKAWQAGGSQMPDVMLPGSTLPFLDVATIMSDR
jgi:regulator of protease activity HflC (stomatin/prohibitin superfamily)